MKYVVPAAVPVVIVALGKAYHGIFRAMGFGDEAAQILAIASAIAVCVYGFCIAALKVQR